MLSRSLCRRSIAEVVTAINSGKHTELLKQLNEKKKLRQNEENVDYCRALCFLAGRKDVLHARQALLEELRHFPNNIPARNLLYEINGIARSILLPPEEVMKGEPLFALLCDALLDHTMLSWTRLYSLYHLAKEICSNNKNEGVLMECGVAGGGSAVLLAVVAAHYSKQPRKVYAFDTFNGMPDPTLVDVLSSSHNNNNNNNNTSLEANSWGSGTCSALQDNVRQLARNFNVEDQLIIIPGMFHETMPSILKEIPKEGIVMLHVDADWYESTKCVLELAWPKVAKGGVVQVDDYYYWNGCAKAVDEFCHREKTSVTGMEKSLQLHPVDGNAVYFTKS
ncbi:macrocin-O-methyltransferase domain-containing protein [Trypanosoma theileri]|uniref:Macrocin-O-methyltransferase domain-containing protein n=1 Tax=Trypanosoma theileri TaxID=67003 RepID=A0A1X0P072_9TRYP|nr:macrocin-O-methyltransferase domain-containing protein [Trypanosoma theileri]ORC90337.1 macrocin-O-methyltransferase domain-containing protein [Trypanosoma theileri]